ncbi:hypothetical protein L1987_01138 [Smallanthus sonchifolius]|uniref:Uncharacterized protein n=1 Tax=Smallanthus sonchifolius TaxID=185202 RepID=A0ACB9K4H1_9ASTR|nr:hypothetical protein L1987_01138 [Smallanthus sonchifolius]
MQSDQQHFLQVGNGNIPNPSIRSSFFGQNVDFQPSKICPRNFIIFDRTDNQSQIMFHPAMAPKFVYPGAGYFGTNTIVRYDENAPKEAHSLMKEDSADIDLLLSSEEEEYEDEELSTARTTHENDASDTADSCSLKPRKPTLGLSSTSHKSRGSSERKRDKMRKMVNSFRRIVPGGNRMNTMAVIDEAVKYLKSLKVELQKVGAGSLEN